MTDVKKFQDKVAKKEDAATIARRRQQATQKEPDMLHAAEGHNRENINRNTAEREQGKGGRQNN